MLDIFEIAKEEGMKEGIKEGIKEGEMRGTLKAFQDLTMDTLMERFNVVSHRIIERIKSMNSPEILKMLHRQAIKCQNIQEFESVLEQVA